MYDIDDFVDGPFQALVRHWLDIRPSNGGVPERSDLDPLALKPALRSLHILEWTDPPEVCVYRLCGTAETERIGQELRGRNFMDFIDPVSAAYCRKHLYHVSSWPCGTLMTSFERNTNGLVRTTRFLSLPLHKEATGSLQIACMVDADSAHSFDSSEKRCGENTPWSDEIRSIDFLDIGAGLPDLPSFSATA